MEHKGKSVLNIHTYEELSQMSPDELDAVVQQRAEERQDMYQEALVSGQHPDGRRFTGSGFVTQRRLAASRGRVLY